MKSKWILQHGVGKLHKKSNSTLRAKRATCTMLVDKRSLKMPKKVNFASFCEQAVLPDRPLLIGQKLLENAQIQKL